MIAQIRQHIRRHSGLLCLLLVAAFLIRPVLIQAGDLHNLEHAELTIEHAAHDHWHAAEHAHESDESRSILHQFMHATHSCGALAALPFSVCPVLSPVPGTAPSVEPDSAFVSTLAEPDLRPPISSLRVMMAATA